MSSLIRLCAISVISRASRSPETAMRMIGDASTSNLTMTGGSMLCGQLREHRRDLVAHVLRGLGAVALEEELHDDARQAFLGRASCSSSMPWIWLIVSSSGLVTRVSTSSTDAPFSVVLMLVIGKSTLGKRSTPSRAYDIAAQHDEQQHQHGREHRPPDAELGELHERPSAGAADASAAGLSAARAGAHDHLACPR